MARAWWIALLVFAGCSMAAQLGSAHPAATLGPATAGTPVAMAAGGEHRMVPVPNVIGKTADEARVAVKAAGFTSEVEIDPGLSCERGPDDPAPSDGRVDCQSPDPGKLVSSYAMVKISVHEPARRATGLTSTELHKLIGMTVPEARQRLHELGHTGKINVRTTNRFMPECRADRVCDYGPHAELFARDDISLFLNKPKLDISAPSQ
jgi:PASTA domain-containing protein